MRTPRCYLPEQCEKQHERALGESPGSKAQHGAEFLDAINRCIDAERAFI